MKVTVVGVGMVGTQVYNWFKDRHETLSYDTKKTSDSWDECSKADVFFVCVPTPYKEGVGYDLTALDETLEKIPNGCLVVIKSTVNPGTSDKYQAMYPLKQIMFNPEFLTELSAEEDFKHPDMQILGISKESEPWAIEIMLMLPPAPTMRVVSLIDAEWIKKVRNVYYAMKVIFFNQISDMVESPADYETIRSVVVKDPRIGDSHSFVHHKGYRGYGGNCLPKDLDSLLEVSSSELLSKVKEINEKYQSEK